jgi:hypothetical protein
MHFKKLSSLYKEKSSMALRAIDPSYNNGIGNGAVYALTGTELIVLPVLIQPEIIGTGIAPIFNSSTGQRYEKYSRIVTVNPLIEIVTEPSDISYYSSPDTTKKYGTFYYVNSYKIRRDDEGNPIGTEPYLKSRNFIQKQFQSLPSTCMAISQDPFIETDYEDYQNAGGSPPIIAFVWSPRTGTYSNNVDSYSTAIQFNFPTGVTANLYYSYYFTSYNVFNTDYPTFGYAV